jgi:hypothetical protein
MGNYTEIEVAFAASVSTRIATPDLEVYARAVTLRGRPGELCPSMGSTDPRPMWAPASSTSARYGSADFGGANSAFTVQNMVQKSVKVSTTRTGYKALSGTG